MSNGSGVSLGDRNRNAKLARLRALVPTSNAIIGIDLADNKQMVVVTDHDHLLVVGQVDPDDRVARRHQRTQPSQLRVSVAVTPRHPTTVTHERPPPAIGTPSPQRIRGTFPIPAPTRRTSFYAASRVLAN